MTRQMKGGCVWSETQSFFKFLVNVESNKYPFLNIYKLKNSIKRDNFL